MTLEAHARGARKSVVVYGRRVAEEILRHQPKRIEQAFVVSGASFSPALSELLEALPRLRTCSKEEAAEQAETHQHQGIVLKVSPREQPGLSHLLEQYSSQKQKKLALVLDRVQDPQNLGSLLRVAEASGVDFVAISKRHSAPISATVRKASAGASELVDVCQVGNLQHALREIKAAGYWIAGTTLSDKAESLFEREFPFPLALVLGSEGSGIRELTTKECDILVKLPMYGALESLNVSQAAAVFLFEALRQRGEGQ